MCLGEIKRSYAAGSITSSNVEPSGIAAYDDGDATVTDSYWNINTTGVLSNSKGGTPLTTDEMKDSTNFSNFEFATIWDIDEGYPFLKGGGKLGSVPVSNEEYSDVSNKVSLKQNYPKPFNPTTLISYNLPESDVISLRVFDILGREVATLIDQNLKSAASHTFKFNAENLYSGVYIYRLESESTVISKKFTRPPSSSLLSYDCYDPGRFF